MTKESEVANNDDRLSASNRSILREVGLELTNANETNQQGTGMGQPS